MPCRSPLGAVALLAALSAALSVVPLSAARAFDDAKYPDWKGQWVRIGGGGQFDPAKPGGRGQQPPLTAEYRAIWEANLAEAAAGGQNYNTQVHCLPGGMPRMMMAYEPMEIIVTPDITYVQISFNNEFRRIYTDGRDWPKDEEPSYSGYSIGKWIDADADGRYHALAVETRNLKGPRIFDPSGIPLHKDNQTIVKERIFLNAADADVLRDEITTIDHALTRPWTITRSYRRVRNPVWVEHICAENNTYVFIGEETYVISADGNLMPTKKNQAPPDLRYFNQSRK
jgi:hypothetical protein